MTTHKFAGVVRNQDVHLRGLGRDQLSGQRVFTEIHHAAVGLVY